VTGALPDASGSMSLLNDSIQLSQQLHHRQPDTKRMVLTCRVLCELEKAAAGGNNSGNSGNSGSGKVGEPDWERMESLLCKCAPRGKDPNR